MTREEARAEARTKLAALKLGETAEFLAPELAGLRFGVYQAIQGVAANLLGNGRYRISSRGGGPIRVTRVDKSAKRDD